MSDQLSQLQSRPSDTQLFKMHVNLRQDSMGIARRSLGTVVKSYQRDVSMLLNYIVELERQGGNDSYVANILGYVES